MTIKVKHNYSNSLSSNWKVKAIEIHNWNCLKELVQWMGGWSHLPKLWRSGFRQKAKLFSKSLQDIYPRVFTHRKVLMSRYVSKSKYDHLLAMCARQDIQKISRGMMSEKSKRLNKEYEERNNKRNLDGWCRKPGTRLATAPHGLRRRRSRTWKFTFNICILVFEYFFCVFKSLCVYESLYFCVCLVGE